MQTVLDGDTTFREWSMSHLAAASLEGSRKVPRATVQEHRGCGRSAEPDCHWGFHQELQERSRTCSGLV
jgi:hypothetical protein